MANIEVLAVTAAVALVLWVLLGFALYYTEYDNPDSEMASNYNHVPNSMWITLLNLSGESPLCQYSLIGKVITGLLGLFATGYVLMFVYSAWHKEYCGRRSYSQPLKIRFSAISAR